MPSRKPGYFSSADLSKLQETAPKPVPINRDESEEIPDAPDFYGLEYHGVIGNQDAEKLFYGKPDGSYLVRKSPNRKKPEDTDFYILCFKFDGKVHHFKLYYNPVEGHFISEEAQKFEKLEDLVAEGLLNYHMYKHAKTLLTS